MAFETSVTLKARLEGQDSPRFNTGKAYVLTQIRAAAWKFSVGKNDLSALVESQEETE